MKQKIILLLLLNCLIVNAQSWQWGKRGGSTDNLGLNSLEGVTDIVTDSQNNIYMISPVGKNGLNIDGHIKTYYGGTTIDDDFALVSFACDGSYRWSKIIGGASKDIVNSLQVDALDNVYICGRFGTCNNTTYPPRIDDDVIISQTPMDCSLLFITKFDANGNMLWFKRPQASSVTFSEGFGQSGSFNMVIDGNGFLNWLISIPSGVYANGAYVNNLPGSTLHILKYDNNGNFIQGIPLDIQVAFGFYRGLRMDRNPTNGYFYFTASKQDNSGTAVVGGQTMTHTAFLACFNDLLQFQWVRENTSTSNGSLLFFNTIFDSDNNIYLSGRLIGNSMDSFVNFSIPEFNIPSFVMKVNPNATTKLWSTYYTNFDNAYSFGTIKLYNNQILFSGRAFGTFTWGNQTINVNSANQGTQPLLARFNKDTGACIGLHNISNNLLTEDVGTALAVDSNGDYIMGGSFGSQLNFTTNSATCTGSQGDFFIAKYSTSVCSLGVDDFKEEGLQLSPNPVRAMVEVRTKQELQYSLYSQTGVLVKEGTLSEFSNQIDFNEFASGVYILKTNDIDGNIKSVKLIKD